MAPSCGGDAGLTCQLNVGMHGSFQPCCLVACVLARKYFMACQVHNHYAVTAMLAVKIRQNSRCLNLLGLGFACMVNACTMEHSFELVGQPMPFMNSLLSGKALPARAVVGVGVHTSTCLCIEVCMSTFSFAMCTTCTTQAAPAHTLC